MLLGSCSCAALLQAFHGLMHKLHSLHPCNLAIAEAKLALLPHTVVHFISCSFLRDTLSSMVWIVAWAGLF